VGDRTSDCRGRHHGDGIAVAALREGMSRIATSTLSILIAKACESSAQARVAIPR
jgi:hypothetical protein